MATITRPTATPVIATMAKEPRTVSWNVASDYDNVRQISSTIVAGKNDWKDAP